MTIQKAEIVPINVVMKSTMAVPDYQRPYRWKEQTALTLFNDIIQAYENNRSEYRIGTLILHNEGNETYSIVDGQQRMTSLTLILYSIHMCFEDNSENDLPLLSARYKAVSIQAIRNNSLLFNRKITELINSFGKEYIGGVQKYILNNCFIVRIVTDSEQEAFQFFDSQNSRGKELEPHDLLKAYHLREMNNESEEVKRVCVNHWESLNQEQVSVVFQNFLYPIIQWYRKRDGRGYDISQIKIFKGIRIENAYPYATYHKASYLFIEEFNSKNYSELTGRNQLTENLLTAPIIAGRRFFSFVSYYYDLTNEVDKIISNKFDKNLTPNEGTGDRYIRRLLLCSLVMLADRFGIESINNNNVLNIMYTWVYSLRLVMHAVSESTINNYAIGRHERINSIPMFEIISDMQYIQDIEGISLNSIAKDNKIKKGYLPIAQHINKINYEGFVDNDR